MEKQYPKWSEFEVKANQSFRNQFENLCRMLFCEELDIEQGTLETVKNQAGNETQVVLHLGKLVGFQSKYFDHGFDAQQFKNSLFKAKKYNQDQDTIYLYSNKTPSELQLNNLKEYIASLKMDCEIRFNEQILDKVVASKNDFIYETFFHLNSEAEKIVEYGKKIVESYLEDIRVSIHFNQKEIFLDRQKELDNLEEVLDDGKVAVVTGRGGCGKTGLVKMLLEKYGEKIDAVRIVRGERLNCQSISEMLGTDEHLFFDAYNSFKNKIFVVDSAEQLSLRKYKEEQRLLIRELNKHGWKLVFTCREEDANSLISFIHDRSEDRIGIVEVNPLSEQELADLANLYGFQMPQDPHLRDYIRVPMELDIYLSKAKTDSQLSFSKYKELEWNEKICGAVGNFKLENKEREDFVLRLAKCLYANNAETFDYSSDADKVTIGLLDKNRVVRYDEDHRELRFVHDLYGEWAVTELLERDFRECKSIEVVYEKYKDTVMGRRCFRQWIGEHLLQNNEISDSISVILKQEKETELQEEVMTAILQSDKSHAYLRKNLPMLTENGMAILFKLFFWLPVSCVFISRDELFTSSTVNLVPNGKSWETIIEIIYQLGPAFWPSLYNRILPVLLMWSKAKGRGTATRECGEIVLSLLKDSGDNRNLIYYRAIPILFRSSLEISNEIDILLKNILTKEKVERSSIERQLLEYIIKETDIGNYRLSKCNPQLVMDVWDYCWHGRYLEDDGFAFGHYASYGLDRSFSISMNGGWAETSMVYSLLADNRFAKEYLPSFLDKCVECFIKNIGGTHQLRKIAFEMHGETIEQWGNEELWCAYRNRITSGIPELIVCLLEALQWFLDSTLENGRTDCEYLRCLINSSKNVMVTAVVTSVALKHLDVCRELVDELASNEELNALDHHRWATEYESYDVSRPSSINFRTTLVERDSVLKDNVQYYQAISLHNYKTNDYHLPASTIESILNDSTMAPVKWTIQVFGGQRHNLDEAARFVKKAKDEFEQLEGIDFLNRLSFSQADAVAAAYIMICKDVDETADWCRDVITEVLKESYRINRPAALYDGVDYCLRTIPKLLELFPEHRKNIFDALLLTSINIRERANMRPLDECLVEIIREGDLWDLYQTEMTDYFAKYISLCCERSDRLLPKEVSFALRILPLKDLNLQMKIQRVKLIWEIFKFSDDDLNNGRLTIKQLSEPVAENVLRRKGTLTGKLALLLINHKLTSDRIADAYLYGLLHELSAKEDVTGFFDIWKQLAIKVLRNKKQKDYNVIRLKRTLTFQESSDIVLKMAGFPVFVDECYLFMSNLVSKYTIDTEIVTGLMVMAEYSKAEKLSAWIGLLQKALGKTIPNIITYAGLSRMEELMRACQIHLSREIETNPDLRAQMIFILDRMIKCGSSRAYAMKEYL